MTDKWCTDCHVAVINRLPRSREPMPVPPPHEWISIDVVQNPYQHRQSRPLGSDAYILTVIDVGAKFFTIIDMPGNKATHVINALIKYQAQHGTFKRIRADAGSEMISSELQDWCNEMNIKIDNSPPEGQNTNGFNERN